MTQKCSTDFFKTSEKNSGYPFHSENFIGKFFGPEGAETQEKLMNNLCIDFGATTNFFKKSWDFFTGRGI
jgi:hypothetical protein